MSEKVLGIKKSIVKSSLWLDLAEEKGYLVPIRLASESVELKALEEWIRKNQYIEWDGKCSCGKEFTISHPDELKYISVKDLIKWAEKEAKK